MRKLWIVKDAQGKVLFEHKDETTARDVWRKDKEAKSVTDVYVYGARGDDIALLDLLARAAEGEKQIEADQPEDEEYFKTSTVLQGCVP